MILFALNREGMAGVWGVCGEIGFPGDDSVEIDVPATMGGTLESCLLDELDERCKRSEDDIESDKAAFESLIRWNLVKAAVVRLVDASADALSLVVLKLFKSFFWSSIFKKSEMLSSSVAIDPELAPPPSAKISDPGCAADEAMLALPLLLLSSSVLLPPPDDNFAFLCPKLLLYLVGAGFGELDPEDATACSCAVGELRKGTEPRGPRVEGVRTSANAPSVDVRPRDPRANGGAICSVCKGDADNEGVLKGMNDTDGLRPTVGAPSAERRDDLDPWADRLLEVPFNDCRSVGD